MERKGFSLVELIIVIAIMAILVGVMAPMLMRYIEKSNVSADIQLCDTVREAINIARSNIDIRNDPSSAPQIDYLESGNIYSINMTSLTAQTAFTDEVAEIIGCKVIGNGADGEEVARSMMKSKVAKNSGLLVMQMDGNNLYVWIDHSDAEGKDNDHTCSNLSNVETSGVIYSR